MLWSCVWDHLLTWAVSCPHRTSPSPSPRILLTLHTNTYVYFDAAYWEEINPLLAKWRSINDARCPECARMIRVNMSRHLRLTHTTHVCYWRCPVPFCPLWFTSELNGKDHIENIHNLREGRGYSFYECLREFVLEWFGSRAFFAEKNTTGQALWMDLALARRSGQELCNTSRPFDVSSLQRSTNSNCDMMPCQLRTA